MGGCHLCKILIPHVLSVASEAENPSIRIKAHMDPYEELLDVSVGTSGVDIAIYIRRCMFRHPKLDNRDVSISYFLQESFLGREGIDTNSAGRLLPVAHFSDSAGVPDAVFDMIRDWLWHCDTHHPDCKVEGAFELPTRVVDVGSREGRGANPVLVVTKNGQASRYLTLSHRWGSPEPLQTTSGNLQERCRGIPLKSIPKTYRDAIMVTQQLGIRYLWIDSLCIIQDDEQDWARESSKMADVYRGSYCNLAADGSPNRETGFLLERGRPQVTTCQIPSSMGWHGSWHISPLAHKDTYITENLFSGPLSSRGWVLQERVLPRRTIHFLPNQIIWECREMYATERKYLKAKRAPHAPETSAAAASTATVSTETPPATTIFMSAFSGAGALLYPAWYQMVELYMQRNLSFTTDRFPAIWSLAEVFRERTGDHYVAGLWEQDLLAGLVFSRETEDESRPGANETSPSWSWAFMEGIVRFGGAGRKSKSPHDAEIVSIQVDQLEPNSMGRVRKAAITMSAYSANGWCRPQRRPGRPPGLNPFQDSPTPELQLLDRYGRMDLTDHMDYPLISDGRPELPRFDPYTFGGYDNNENPEGNTKWWRDVCVNIGICDDRSSVASILFDKRETANKYAGSKTEAIMLLYIGSGFGHCDENHLGLAVVPVNGRDSEYRRVGLFYGSDYGMTRNPPHWDNVWKKKTVILV